MACMYPSEQQRVPYWEGQEMLASQLALAPSQYSGESALAQAYQALQQNLTQQGLYGTEGGNVQYTYRNNAGQMVTKEIPVSAMPGLINMAGGATQGMQGVLGQAQAGATGYNLAEFARISPEISRVYSQAMNQANPDQQALLQALNQQALGELNMGAQLDPSLQREVSQAVRGGQAARGMGYGNADLFSEAMTRGQAGQALRQRRQQFAGNVAGLNQQARIDPLAAIMGTYQPISAGSSVAAGMGVLNQAGQTGTPQYANPFTNYGSDVFGSNQSAAMDAAMARANYWTAFHKETNDAIGDVFKMIYGGGQGMSQGDNQGTAGGGGNAGGYGNGYSGGYDYGGGQGYDYGAGYDYGGPYP